MQQLIEVVPPEYSNYKLFPKDVEGNYFTEEYFLKLKFQTELNMSSTILPGPFPALGTLEYQIRASSNGHQPRPLVAAFV